MTPDDFESQLERLGRRLRPDYGVDEAWVQVRKATVEADELSSSAQRDGHGKRPRLRWRDREGSLKPQPLRRGIFAIGTVGMLVLLVLFAHHWPSGLADVTRTYTTNAGQEAVLTLNDRTRVILAPQTTLRLVHFGDASRAVLLDRGEAYFSVARAAGNPFIVQSGSVSTRVLGTAFLVRHDAVGGRVRVAVESGKVRVTNGSRVLSAVTLTSGQIGDVADSTVRIDTDDLLPGVERAPGRLMFHDTPVATILQMVSQWYGYQFRYADHNLANRPVNMVISTQSSAKALATIELVLAVNLQINGDTVTLIPQPPKSTRAPSRIRTYDVWTPTQEVGR